MRYQEIKFYKSRLLSNTSLVEKLEVAFANYTGFKYAVAVDSCTNAIRLCLEYSKPKKVSIPTMTYVSVANEILHCGAELELLDEEHVGYAYQLQGTNIWDSAHEVCKDTGKTLGTYDAFCYSFYPTKLVPSYQGGMICTNNQHLAKWLKVARQMGRTGYGAYYDVEFPGWKYNMTPIQAKEALTSLNILDKVKEKQWSQSTMYWVNFSDTECITASSYHLFRIKVQERDLFIKYMKDFGIECSIHFKPIHQFTAYKQYDKGQFPKMDELYKSIVSLPIHPYLTKRQQDYIIKKVKEWNKLWKEVETWQKLYK